jgi:hypothetical protein
MRDIGTAMSRRRYNIRALAALAVAASIACDSEKVCAGGLYSTILPSDTTIAVGQSILLQVKEGAGCTFADAVLAPLPLTWSTIDTLVVRLERTTGRVTGLAVGDANVVAGDFKVRVHVR